MNTKRGQLVPITEKLYRLVIGRTLFADQLKEVQSNIIIPTKRGEFNPYKIFQIEYPWQRYEKMNKADLSYFERFDRFLTLYHRKTMNYQKYGLLFDDILQNEDAIMVEALNRLPKEVRDARDRRLDIAHNLSELQKSLPKDEWTTPAQDVPYLMPYIMWVTAEMEEFDALQQYLDNSLPRPWSSYQVTDKNEDRKLRFID